MLTGQPKEAHCWLTRQPKCSFFGWPVNFPVLFLVDPSTNYQPTSPWLTSQPSVDVFWLTRQPKTTKIGWLINQKSPPDGWCVNFKLGFGWSINHKGGGVWLMSQLWWKKLVDESTLSRGQSWRSEKIAAAKRPTAAGRNQCLCRAWYPQGYEKKNKPGAKK